MLETLLTLIEPPFSLTGGCDRLLSLLIEGEDLQLGGEVDLTHVHVRRHVHDCRSEVQYRLHAGVDEAIGHFLGRGWRSSDDPDRDVFVGDVQEAAQVDGEPRDRRFRDGSIPHGAWNPKSL